MKRRMGLVVFSLFIGFLSATARPDEALGLFFKLSDYYLSRHVYNGLVNYQYTASNFREMDLLYQKMADVDLANASRNEKKAFYINAYNILVIYQVAKAYPLNKPSDQEGFFDNMYHVVAGRRVTLNELEQDILLREFKDPRLHFALACAAMSCPKLYNKAYIPENVEQLLEERTRKAINDPSFIRVRSAQQQVQLSKIFEWYSSDFKTNGETVMGFINKYREEKIPDSYRIGYYEYDWTLNERKV